MNPRDLINKGNTLSVSLYIGKTAQDINFATTLHSPEYMICGSTLFKLSALASLNTRSYVHEKRLNYSVFIKFTNCHPDDDLDYAIKFTSNKLSIKDKCFTSDDGNWRLVNEILLEQNQPYVIDVAVQTYVIPSVSSFLSLYEDTDLLDFEFRGEGGSVHFHKCALAASSPVLRRMLGGTWRETNEGRVDVPGTSKTTLQDLKNYIYMHTLPDKGIEQLLLLSLYYMIPDLEKMCVIRLMERLTPQNACHLFKFAGKHEVTRLLLAILDCMRNSSLDLKEMRNHFLQEEKIANTANN